MLGARTSAAAGDPAALARVVAVTDIQHDRLSARGAALLDAGRAAQAVEVLRHAVAAGEPNAVELMVQALVAIRDWHTLASWLGPLVEQGHVRFAGALGMALVALGERERGEETLRLAVDCGELAAANDLGILLRDEGRLGEAVDVLDRAATAGDGQAAANLVEVLLESGDLVGAGEAAQRYADPARPDTLVALADVRAEQGRHDEAEQCYRRACELRALRGHIAYGGFLLAVRGDLAGAERELRAAAERGEPGWSGALGRLLFDDGRGEEARPYLEHAAADGDPDAELLLAQLDGIDPADD